MDGRLVLRGAGAERDETGGDEGKLEIEFHNAKIDRFVGLFAARLAQRAIRSEPGGAAGL